MKKLIVFILLINSIIAFSQEEFSYKEKKELKGYPDYIMDARFSPFRNYFAIAIGNNTLQIYDKNWKKIFEHQGNPKSVGGHLCFSPDEKYLAYAKYKSDNDIAIINLEDQKVIQVLNAHANHINKLEFSHNGMYLASTSSDESVAIWKWEDDQLVLFQKFNYDDAPMGISFSYNDEYLVCGGYDRTVHLYQLKNNKYVFKDTIANLKYYLYDICFHPFKNEFIASTQYEARRYTLTNQKFSLKDSLKIRVNRTVKYNSTGKYLVFGSDNDVSILKMDNGQMAESENIYRHSDHVFGGTFSEDGLFLTTFSSDKSCIVWELTGIEPSRKSLVSDYMDGELTSAQKVILTGDVIEKILNNLDKKLIAPRDEFETTFEYNDRRANLKAEVLKYLQEFTEKHYQVKSKSGDKVLIPINRIIGYNADLGITKFVLWKPMQGLKFRLRKLNYLKETGMKLCYKPKSEKVKMVFLTSIQILNCCFQAQKQPFL